jgi:hypothetical protein
VTPFFILGVVVDDGDGVAVVVAEAKDDVLIAGTGRMNLALPLRGRRAADFEGSENPPGQSCRKK